MANDGVDTTPDERPEDPATAFERDCVQLLAKANELAACETHQAQLICNDVGKLLVKASQQKLPGVPTVYAMYSLLCANLAAYSSRRTKRSLNRLRNLYSLAITAAAGHAADALYVFRAKRAFAAALVYHRKPAEALPYLEEIHAALERSKDKELRDEDLWEEDLWVQTTMQLAEVRWMLGAPDEAHRLLESIDYPDHIHMYHVAAKILHARLCWHTAKDNEMQEDREAQHAHGVALAQEAAADVHRVASQCHPGSERRAQLLRLPLGIRLYELLAYRWLRCPRI